MSEFLIDAAHAFPCFQWHSADATRLPDAAEILAASPACPVNAMAWGTRAFSIQFHVEITASTVAQWGQVPGYAAALEQALGEGALGRLENKVGERMTSFNTISEQLYSNLMAIVQQR